MSIFDPDTIFNVPADTEQLVGRRGDLKAILPLLANLKKPAIQLIGEHGVGKSTLLRTIGHRLHLRKRGLNVLYVDCRPSIQRGGVETKSREGLVRDLAAASGGLQGLDASDREHALLRRFHNGSWAVLLDSFESTLGGPAEDFARQIGLSGTASLVIATTAKVEWIDDFHKLEPLGFNDVLILVRRGVGGVQVPAADVEAAAKASQGLPELALRAGRLLNSGVASETVIASVKHDQVSYYRAELEQVFQSPLHNRIVSLGLAIAAPMTVDVTAAILGTDAAESAKALMLLRDQGLFDFYDRRYRPRDLLVTALDAHHLDLTVLDGFFGWLSKYLPDESGFTWSRTDIGRCDGISDYIRAFLRLDQIALGNTPPDGDDYARLGANLAAWMACQGYWLELDRLAERIDNSLWNIGDTRYLIKVHLLWRLKSLLKRNLYSEAWSLLVRLIEGMSSLRDKEQDLLKLSLSVCASQMRHAPAGRTLVQGLLRNPSLQSLWPTPEEVILAESRLKQLGETELLCISINRRGNMAAEDGDLRTAEELYKDAERLGQTESGPWSAEMLAIARGNLGVVRNRGQRWLEAIQVLSPAEAEVAQESERAVVLAELSRAYFQLGDRRTGLKCWAKAERIVNALALDRPRCESDPLWTPPPRFGKWMFW